MGLEMVAPGYFSTAARREQLQRALATNSTLLDHDGAALSARKAETETAPLDESRKFGTVGAVASIRMEIWRQRLQRAA